MKLLSFLRRVLPAFLFSAPRVCAWCSAEMARGGLFAPGDAATHGICKPCAERARHEMRKARELRRQLTRVGGPFSFLLMAAALVSCDRDARTAAAGDVVAAPSPVPVLVVSAFVEVRP